MRQFLGIATLFLLAGCASQPLSQEENNVRVLRKSDAPADCKQLGRVIARGYASLTDEGREADLKRETHKLGGNTVTWDRSDENNTVYGSAFSCPLK